MTVIVVEQICRASSSRAHDKHLHDKQEGRRWVRYYWVALQGTAGTKSIYYDVIRQRDQTAEEIRPKLAIRELEDFRKQLLEQT